MQIHKITLLLAVLIFLDSCDQQPAAQANKAEVQEFGASEKAIARVLSISNNNSLEGSDSPLVRAARCRIALSELAQILASRELLQQNQTSVMEQAVEHYRAQVEKLSRDAGLSPEEKEDTLRKLEIESDLDGKNGRTAIACLRQLEDLPKA